ncbi:DDRGK domain-containing protein 1-like [Limulus polyphemus]|uniref:DDRGK domain-containing protein 1 n=1 Tax=Limulus polyphemus TaxID=6850 RepID=A0ABM1BXX9_LIMPO|nr:DDRGK domain-containing protein 1-like [Limulus polyphemus]
MDGLIIILISAISLIAVLLIATTFLRGRPSKTVLPGSRAVPINREDAQGPRRAVRNVRHRMRAAAAREQEGEEDEEDTLFDEIAMPEGKVGAKKRKKLEMKAEKRAQREREEEEREERRQRNAMLEEERKKEEEKQKEEEQKREEEEKRVREEKEKQEYEEYLKMKEAFSVEEEGYDEAADEQESHNKLQEFVDYIKTQKVVLLEDLAAKFKLKTQEAVDRVQELLSQERLVGVIDDRGKFIHITREELESVAQFIHLRGRVSITELMESSNNLINLQPDHTEAIFVQ